MRRRTIIAVFTVLGLCGVVYAMAKQSNGASRQHFDLPTSGASALQRSVPLCRLVCPESSGLSVEPESSNPDSPAYWQVTSNDKSGSERLRLDWDARSGAMIQLCSVQFHLEGDRLPPLSDEELHQCAHRWLTSVSPTQERGGWEIYRVQAGLGRRVWHAYASSGVRRAHVAVNARTGQLLMLQSYTPHGKLPFRSAINGGFAARFQ